MRDEDVAIASNMTTLDDLLKTKICKGKMIHCQFTQKYLTPFELRYIKKVAEDIGVKQISFQEEQPELELSQKFKLLA